MGDSLTMQQSPSKTNVPWITLHVQYIEVLRNSIFLLGMAMHI